MQALLMSKELWMLVNNEELPPSSTDSVEKSVVHFLSYLRLD